MKNNLHNSLQLAKASFACLFNTMSCEKEKTHSFTHECAENSYTNLVVAKLEPCNSLVCENAFSRQGVFFQYSIAVCKSLI